jgi:hypothetical protein
MREIRAGVPTVIMSGYAKEEVRKRFGESKNIRFLQKPFFLSELSRLTGE